MGTTASPELDLPWIDDGAEFDHNGHRFRIRIEYDEWGDPFGEFDCYGRITESRWDNDMGWRKPRPDGFDGAARVISTRDGDWWWQPPEGVTSEEGVRFAYNLARDILEYGMIAVGVERLGVCDLGHTHVVDSRWIGGIEPFPKQEDLQEFVEQLLWEIGDNDE